MPLYSVALETEIVVCADSMDDAEARARLLRYQFNWDELIIYTIQEIRTKEDLPEYWTSDCLPYCAQDNRMIAEYL